MASRDKYVEEFRALEQRFLRVAQHGTGDRDLDAACAAGGVLVWQATAEGLLPIELPAPRIEGSANSELPGIWQFTWMTAAVAYSIAMGKPDPTAPRMERRESSGAEAVFVGNTSRADWRIHAENYSQLCRDYIALLSEDRPAVGLVTRDDLTLLLGVSKKRLGNLLSEWRKDGRMKGPGPYEWQTVRPILVEHKPDREAFMPVDYESLREQLKRLRDLN